MQEKVGCPFTLLRRTILFYQENTFGNIRKKIIIGKGEKEEIGLESLIYGYDFITFNIDCLF